jgi:microsomal dipeptidase-like Zn-dependent dipeptidase
MTKYLNEKNVQKSLLRQIREELRKRGYSEEAIGKILRWYL